MEKDKIDIIVNKDGMVSFHDFIEMKIKYEEHYKEKDKVINDLLSRIAKLEYEAERLESKINQVDKYIDKMSYCDIVDNPKKDLQKILRK